MNIRSAFDMSIGCQFNIMLRILENAILSFMSCNDTPSPWKTEVDDGKVTRQEPNSFADQLIRASPCQAEIFSLFIVLLIMQNIIIRLMK